MHCKIAYDDAIQFIWGVVEPRPCFQGEPTWYKLHYNDINGFNWGNLILKNLISVHWPFNVLVFESAIQIEF